MARTRRMSTEAVRKRSRPALTPEARENQVISEAMDLAEKQIREGTASSQVITHFLKLGTVKAQLENERLKHENELLKAKTEAIQSAKNIEALYAEAIDAMKNYAGYGDEEYEE